MDDLRGLQYKPVRVLGEGSHGLVLLVEHVRLAKPFVMKLIQQKFLANKDVVGRFIAEAQRGAKLNHEAFAPIVDLGETQDGRTYFVMEYVEGNTLQQALQQRGAFPVDQALVLGLQLLDGLAAAHDAHLIHRDIKPANLFLTGRGRLKILDLGISKSIIDSGTGPNTAHGVAIGTPKYMSPEQAKGQPVTFATDLYAVALVLFEMLTGEAVFDGLNAQDLLRRHIFEPPPTLAERGRRPFAPSLEAILARALSKNPAERFQTAREMQAALHAVLETTRTDSGLAPSRRESMPPPTAAPIADATSHERERPTVRVSESVPPAAFATGHVSASNADRSSTRPVSADALVIGAASTQKQAIVIQQGSTADATARTEALAAVTDAQPVETGGATTRTHDELAVEPGTTVPGSRRRPSKALVFAAVFAAFGLVLGAVAALLLVLRTDHRAEPARASTPASVGTVTSVAASASGATPTAPSSSPSAVSAAESVSIAAPPSSSASLVKPAPAKPKPNNHYAAAVEAMNDGDLETADEEARLAVAGGGGTRALLLHARILEQRGKKAAARDIYRQILEKDPTMAAAVAGLKRCGG